MKKDGLIKLYGKACAMNIENQILILEKKYALENIGRDKKRNFEFKIRTQKNVIYKILEKDG